MRFNAQGQLVDYRSRVTWLRDGAEFEPDVAGIGHPAELEGVALHQIAYSPIVRLQAHTPDGRALLLQSDGQAAQGRESVTVRFVSSDDQPLVFVPQRELFFTFVFEPDCGDGRPVVHLYQIGQGGTQRQRVATLHDSGEISLDDMQLDAELSYVPVLRLGHYPGMRIAFAALGTALLALIFSWVFPARLAWVKRQPKLSCCTSKIRLNGKASPYWTLPRTMRT